MLPSGPHWKSHTLQPWITTKCQVILYYRNPVECIQSLLSHPLFMPHISFIPQKVWTSFAQIVCVYQEWLLGNHAWDLQVSLLFPEIHSLSDLTKDQIPNGATLLRVVLSSDKTNILVMSGNQMAHPLLLSLANIDSSVQCKGSLHGRVLLMLLPVTSFIYKKTHICSLLSDCLIHECLDLVLNPLKIAATVGIMMGVPIGNLHYCFTPLVAYIADTPEQSLLAGISPKASPVSTDIYKEFGDLVPHPPCTSSRTLEDIEQACLEADLDNFETFLKIVKCYYLNGVHMPLWRNWLLSDPLIFFTPKVLHLFHHMSWDHDLQWCINVLGPAEIDYQLSLIQIAIGYCCFDEGVSNLKQVTGHDHCAMQRYIIAAIVGGIPPKFLLAICSLLDFCYFSQMPCFDHDALTKVEASLGTFHDNKLAILTAGGRQGSKGSLDHWEIPKLELLQHGS